VGGRDVLRSVCLRLGLSQNCGAELWTASFQESKCFLLESADQVGGRKTVARGLELWTLRLLAVCSDQLSTETSWMIVFKELFMWLGSNPAIRPASLLAMVHLY